MIKAFTLVEELEIEYCDIPKKYDSFCAEIKDDESVVFRIKKFGSEIAIGGPLPKCIIT
jgi:hypothetical protein